jgi:peptidoglycan/xylan/chitin deacetylase (PgdA/CDA1 family)
MAQVDRVQELLDDVYAKAFFSCPDGLDISVTRKSETKQPLTTKDSHPHPHPHSHPHPPRYFRPGSGFFSSDMRSALTAKGYTIVLGSVYPHDAQARFAKVNKWHILRGVRPGAIVVCHDGREWTPEMLDGVLKELVVERGYRVGTVSEVLEYQRGLSTQLRKEIS